MVNDQMVNDLIFDIVDYRKKKRKSEDFSPNACVCQIFVVPLQPQRLKQLNI